MKVFKHVLNLSYVAALLCMTSCVNDDFLAVNEPETLNEGNPLTLTVTQGNPSGTRLALGQDGLSTEWEPGDQLVLVDKARQRAPIYLNCTLTTNSNQATFVSQGGVPADDYWVIYNYNEHLTYTHQELSSINEINEQDKLVLYGELTVNVGDTSANISLKHLYAKVNLNIDNLNVTGQSCIVVGMYSAKKNMSQNLQFTQSGLVETKDRIGHNIPLVTHMVDYAHEIDPVTGAPITFAYNLDALDTNSALLMPEDLLSEDVFFYVLLLGDGSSECYEIKKETGKVKLEAGKSYTINLDIASATKTVLNINYTPTGEGGYGIYTPEDWRHAAYCSLLQASGNAYLSNSSYIVMDDIDFEGEYFFPLYDVENIYGNGKTIKNIALEWDEDNVGLCNGYCSDIRYHAPKVSDLTLESVSFTGKNYVGAFGGNRVSVDNCTLTGKSVISGENNVGGIVGLGGTQLTNVSIEKDCTVKGINYVGGIVGACQVCDNSYQYTVLNSCISYATVDATGGNVGGIFGSCFENNIIQKCVNKGNIKGKDYVGGIGGYMSMNGSLDKSFNEGAVSGENYVGGILGSLYGEVNTCYSINTVTGKDGVGGIVGGIEASAPTSEIRNCYSLSDLVVDNNVVAGGIIGYGYGGSYQINNISVFNSYFAGTNPQGSGIIGQSNGGCVVQNCLTTLSSLGTNIDNVSNSQAEVTSILQNIDIINVENAYSTEVWQGYNFDCVKFVTDFNLGDGSTGGVETPDFEYGGDI